MVLLLCGLGLFFAAHLFPAFREARARLGERLGEGPYKLAFTAVSGVGFALIIYGYQTAEILSVYAPLAAGPAIAHTLMPFAFILLAGAHMKSNLKRYVGHPMSLGVALWGASHLTANGDLASVLLFGSFLLYGLLNAFVTGQAKPIPPTQPLHKDAILVAAGFIAYAAAVWAHGAIFGYPVVT